MPFPTILTAPGERLSTLSLPMLAVLGLAACQTTAVEEGSPSTAASPASLPADDVAAAAETSGPKETFQTEGAYQEMRARNAGFQQLTGVALRGTISGHTYAYDHPRGARITVSFSPDGQTFGNWTHPSGMRGEFREKWVIRDNEELCGVSDEGTKCGSLFRKDDLLVKIYESGRVDKLDSIQTVATK